MPDKRASAKSAKGPTKKDLQSTLQKVQEELQAKEGRLDELTSRLGYLQAELENVRKAGERERQEVVRHATQDLLRDLLPVVDELDLALKTMKGRGDDLEDGVRMIRENLLKVLRGQGLEEIPALDEPFDPYVHEAVAFTADGARDGAVVEVLLKGYRTRDRILRPAQVVVCRQEGKEDG